MRHGIKHSRRCYGTSKRTVDCDRIPTGENYERLRKMKANPPKSHYEKSVKRVPDLFLEVTVAPGKLGRIGYKKGDDPAALAESFARTFQLNTQAKGLLHSLLETTIKAELGQHDET